jgi:DNA-binding CsgD family transcriptional regulator
MQLLKKWDAVEGVPTGVGVGAGVGCALSAREREVLLCCAMGLTYKEIGPRLKISRHTVRTHMVRVLRKVGARSAAEAVFRVFAREV